MITGKAKTPKKVRKEAMAKGMRFGDQHMIVVLTDGRELSIPLSFYPTLAKATPAGRSQWEIFGSDRAIEWDALDFQLSVQFLLEGTKEGIPKPPPLRKLSKGRRIGSHADWWDIRVDPLIKDLTFVSDSLNVVLTDGREVSAPLVWFPRCNKILMKQHSLPTRIWKSIRKRYRYRSDPRLKSFRGDGESVLQCCIAYNAYGGYCVPLSARDRPAAQAILAGKIWESETLDYLTAHCDSGDIVHAGTFFGDFLPALSRSCAAGARVWAFEPNPESYRCARVTAAINGVENIDLTHAGLGERQAVLPIVIADASGKSLGGLSRIVDHGDAGNKGRTATVRIMAIDEIIPADRQVSIIQLDVEGFERQALCGARETIRRCRPIIVLETLPEEAWLAENILSLGYRVAGKLHRNTILQHDDA